MSEHTPLAEACVGNACYRIMLTDDRICNPYVRIVYTNKSHRPPADQWVTKATVPLSLLTAFAAVVSAAAVEQERARVRKTLGL